MEVWPFREDDWSSIEEAVVDLVNASDEGDDKLITKKLKEVFDLLEALAIKYGPHPILYETKADIIPNPKERVELYKEAIILAAINSLPTISSRLSLAEVLIEDLADYNTAKKELEACKGELTKDDMEEWLALMERVKGYNSVS